MAALAWAHQITLTINSMDDTFRYTFCSLVDKSFLHNLEMTLTTLMPTSLPNTYGRGDERGSYGRGEDALHHMAHVCDLLLVVKEGLHDKIHVVC